MAQLRRELDLAQEALRAQRLRDLGIHHLDRHVTVVLEVVREVHRGHAARAELALDAIAVGQRGRESRQRIAHPSS